MKHILTLDEDAYDTAFIISLTNFIYIKTTVFGHCIENIY